MLWPSPLEWFSFTMFVVSVPLYILFLVTIIKFRKKEPFNSPFFTLCIALGVGDLTNLFNQWFCIRFEQFDWLGLGQFALKHGIVPDIAAMVSWEFAVMQHIAVACLAFNRFTALVTPNYYTRIWTTKVTSLVIIFEYVSPVPAVIPMAWLEFGYIVDNQTGSVGVPIWHDHESQIIYYRGLLTLNGLANGITLIMYCMTFYKIHRQIKNRKSGKVASSQQNCADTKLSVFGLCVFCVMFVYGVYSFLMAMQPAGDIEAYRFNILLWQTISDIFSWCNPWFIIVRSKKVRGHMLALVCCKPPPNQVVPKPRPAPKKPVPSVGVTSDNLG